MGRRERIEARRVRIEARRKRVEARRKAEADLPPLVQLPANADPLVVYDPETRTQTNTLRNLWRGCAAFYVCGGPSLRQLDLERLRDRGVVSLGINNVAAYAPVRAFTCSDPPEKFHHGIWLDPAILKFVPIPKLSKRIRAKVSETDWRPTAYRVEDCPSVFGYSRATEYVAADFLTTPHASWGQGKHGLAKHGGEKILFTFFLGLRLLHYLGVRRIYLLGVDFQMTEQDGYAFAEQRHEGAVRGNNNHYRIAKGMCDELAPVFAAAGLEVYNSNPESALTTWPYVSYEDALADCRGALPADGILDTHGWYAKQEHLQEEQSSR